MRLLRLLLLAGCLAMPSAPQAPAPACATSADWAASVAATGDWWLGGSDPQLWLWLNAWPEMGVSAPDVTGGHLESTDILAPVVRAEADAVTVRWELDCVGDVRTFVAAAAVPEDAGGPRVDAVLELGWE